MTLQDSRGKLRNCLRNLEDSEKQLDNKEVEFRKAEANVTDAKLAVEIYQKEFKTALDDYITESQLMEEV